MTTREYDVVVAGAGTAGCYAAATAAREGLDVAVVERKDEQEAGHIACGDALKGAGNFPEVIPHSQIAPAFTNTNVDHGRFEIPQEDTVLEIPVPGELAVIDRWDYGRRLIEGAREAGAELHYETVVKDVVQDDGGRVTGLRAINDSDPITYEADVVIDGAGALSLLQDKTDFAGTTFDTNVSYQQFCSAYREIVHVDEPVEWSDALVFKPTKRAAGYLWYFPRSDTEINAGLGFQMTEEPMQLVDDLKRDLRQRAEFEGARVEDKLGAALPTRRPYDSAVAPGFMAVGDAAGHVNPITGGGIASAAYAGTYAGEAAIEAVLNAEPGESTLWEYNQRVMDHFGARYAALDVYNILSTTVDTDSVMSLLAALPGELIAESVYSEETGIPLHLKLLTAIRSFGHWKQLATFYRAKQYADRLLEQYKQYPASLDGLDRWQSRRDDLLDELYETIGADPKY